ncbi:endonuclease domain-containing protein [Ramlibacter sp. AN1133]|uniref:endonuclease domain-containing protein n=1 Tax=Ramlibacter sp. AN1133 TaxID=3133429 RepID=UPI0030BE050C
MGALMRHQAYSKTHSNARELRAGMTDSERKLWSRLRLEQLGVKFRRQHPLGNYIADFACLSPKLIVELDGSQHADQATYDARREQFFRQHGFQVLRFATDEPLRNMDGVLAVIVQQLGVRAERPHPNPPPEGEGVETRKTQ